MIWLSGVLLALAAVGTAYYIISTAALLSVFRGKPVAPAPGATPKVSVLKPVRGIDKGAEENFRSYLRQDYPEYEVLFGVLEADDPAIGTILEVIQGHKHASLHIGTTIRGANDKVRVLHQLLKRASGDIIVISDADTRARPDLLSSMVRPFSEDSVGMVTCLYRGVEATGIADALEGLHMSCVFAPGVACARSSGGLRFGLGAAIAIREAVLRRLGGFEAISDYLADDYELGHRTAALGYRVELSRYVVDDVLSGQGLRASLERELRWSRTIRASRSSGYAGLGLTFGFGYAVLYAAASRFSTASIACLCCVLLARMATAWFGARQAMGDRAFLRRAWLLPARDLLSFGVWLAGYFGRTVRWRGRRLIVRRDGRIKPG